MIQAALGALFNSIVGGVLEWIKGVNHDKIVRRLGHTERELDFMRDEQAANKKVSGVYRDHSGDDLDTVIDGL